jgi:hypothetical protein
MLSSMTKVNPHCPVNGCKTDKPHTDDPVVGSMLAYANTPQVYLWWVKNTLLELRASMADDGKNGRRASWLSRVRLVEELYYRVLYLLFVAAPGEAPHVLSGEPPNSISIIHDQVNDELFDSSWTLKQGLGGSSSPSLLKLLHIGAHGAYPMLYLLHLDKETDLGLDVYLKEVLDVYLERIQKIGEMLVEGITIQHVKDRIIEMHGKE